MLWRVIWTEHGACQCDGAGPGEVEAYLALRRLPTGRSALDKCPGCRPVFVAVGGVQINQKLQFTACQIKRLALPSFAQLLTEKYVNSSGFFPSPRSSSSSS